MNGMEWMDGWKSSSSNPQRKNRKKKMLTKIKLNQQKKKKIENFFLHKHTHWAFSWFGQFLQITNDILTIPLKCQVYIMNTWVRAKRNYLERISKQTNIFRLWNVGRSKLLKTAKKILCTFNRAPSYLSKVKRIIIHIQRLKTKTKRKEK